MEEKITDFIQTNSPDGEFLQSEEWRKFQEATGKRTFNVSGEDFWANIIEHELPIVGKYFYIPRDPIASCNIQHKTYNTEFQRLIDLAKREKTGWIRIEPVDDNLLNLLRHRMSKCGYKIKKAPHDMQPRELFIIDITKSEEELLAEMKAKTRYNIKVAQKHDVKILETCNLKPETQKSYIDEFVKLVKITAKRDGITPHPESYYRKMFETIQGDILKLYVAEYEGKIIAANIIIFYGNTATYLHGASDNEYRNVMAPYLLQWQAIKDAKKAGLTRYDFGGIKMCDKNSWSGITRFKTGFSPNTKPIVFPGSYDIIIDKRKYFLYKFIRKFIP